MLLLVSGATRTVDRLRSNRRIGRLLRPGNGNLPDDLPWAVDNGAFAAFDPDAFRSLLLRVRGLAGCHFVAAPDVVGDHVATLARFDVWERMLHQGGFPVAFVLQDGATSSSVPWDSFEALFVGGSTAFKLGPIAMAIGREAKRRGKWLHVGRVNRARRMRMAHQMGADSIDGTGFSRWPDALIPWALRQLEDIERQEVLPWR
jgi:hypothetical protein